MNLMEVYENPITAATAQEVTDAIVESLIGQRVDVSMSALLGAFIAMAELCGECPSAQAEHVLAAYASRKPRTHGGTLTIQ